MQSFEVLIKRFPQTSLICHSKWILSKFIPELNQQDTEFNFYFTGAHYNDNYLSLIDHINHHVSGVPSMVLKFLIIILLQILGGHYFLARSFISQVQRNEFLSVDFLISCQWCNFFLDLRYWLRLIICKCLVTLNI